MSLLPPPPSLTLRSFVRSQHGARAPQPGPLLCTGRPRAHDSGRARFAQTAILHAFTGVTLLVGYMHARSLDQTVATALATA